MNQPVNYKRVSNPLPCSPSNSNESLHILPPPIYLIQAGGAIRVIAEPSRSRFSITSSWRV